MPKSRRDFFKKLSALSAAGIVPIRIDGLLSGEFVPKQSGFTRESESKWYMRSYRRHFFDMHIPDWNPAFLSKLDPQTIVDNLLLEKVTAVALMFLPHTGLAHYPSKVGKVHSAFEKRDFMKEIIDLCHSNHIDIVMYYCLLYTEWYWDMHPEARTVDVDGNYQHAIGVGNRHAGTLCPNNPGYRKFVEDQLKEISGMYDFEGVWLDMTWWPTVCYCESCKKRYHEEIGGEIPQKIDWLDPVWVQFQRKRQAWLAEFGNQLTDFMKNLKPGVTVAHQSGQFAWGSWRLGASNELARATDWLSADTYADWPTQSYINKLFYSMSRIKPWEHVMGWGYPWMKETVVTRTEEDLRCRAFDAFMNDGAMTFLEAFDPEGTLNQDNYLRGGKVFADIEKYEAFAGGEFLWDFAIYRSFDSEVPNRFEPSSRKELLGDWPVSAGPTEHLPASVAMARILKDNHFPFGVITRKDLETLGKYQVVILPNVAMLSQQEVSALRDYVENGGSVYASKYTSLLTTEGQRSVNFGLSDLFGVDYIGETNEVVTYVRPAEDYKELFLPFKENYPSTLNDTQVIARLKGTAEILAYITLPYTDPAGRKYASILSDPPGVDTKYPSLVLNRFGKGKIMYSAGPIEIWEYLTQRELLGRLLKMLTSKPLFYETDAPGTVEITMFDQPDQSRLILHFLNYQNQLPNIPVQNIHVKVYMDMKKPSQVLLLPDKKEIKFKMNGNTLEFVLAELNDYAMTGIIYH